MIRSLALGLVFGALFLVLAVWGVPLAELRAAFARMEWIYLLHVTVAFAVQYGLRAWRQLVLIRPLAPAADLRSQVAIVLVGFFCVNAFPARLGEAVRPLLFHERHGVPLGAGFGVVFLERVVDLVALFATLLAVLACAEMPERRFELAGGSFSLVELVRSTALVVLLPALAALLALALFGPAGLRAGERVHARLEARRAPAWRRRALRALLRFAASFVEALRILRTPRRLLAVASLTALLFLSMAAPITFLAQAFGLGDRVGLGASLGVLGITMLGIALPAPPGFAGVFEAAMRGGLALFGVSGEAVAARALAIALVFHWWPFLLLGASAGWFLWRDRIGLGRLFRFARGPSGAPAPAVVRADGEQR